MSFDVDEKEFHETMAELEAEGGRQRALEWAWCALNEAYIERDYVYKQREEALQLVTTHGKLVRFLERVRKTYLWVKGTPRRLKYRYFPKHRLRVEVKGDRVVTHVPLAPGMVPETRIWDIGDPKAPVKHIGDKPFFGVLMTPRPKKTPPPEEEKG